MLKQEQQFKRHSNYIMRKKHRHKCTQENSITFNISEFSISNKLCICTATCSGCAFFKSILFRTGIITNSASKAK